MNTQQAQNSKVVADSTTSLFLFDVHEITKKCKCCGEVKPLSGFYVYKEMADGHLNICKECKLKQNTANRNRNIEYYREYDRKRAKLPHRKKSMYELVKRRRREVEGYGRCHNAVNRAVKNGTLVRPETCPICGNKELVVAHHEDYSKPLDVVWMCVHCHIEHHNKNKK